MERIVVLANDEITEDVLPRVEAVDPRISATHVGRLVTAELEGDPVAKDQMDRLMSTAEIFAGRRIPADLVQRAPRLRWVQNTRTGVDRMLMDEAFRRSGIVLTNVAGIHSYGPAEVVMLACLAHVKEWSRCARQQQERRWETFWPEVLWGKTMGIVGYGSIGERVARTAKAFGMRVVATRRGIKGPSKARFADLVLPSSELDRLLAESDFVVLATPLTPETYHLFGVHQFAAMKREAMFINVSRGPTVDEAALAEALTGGRIAAAALDVLEQEPLPPESPLWRIPNLFLSPHIGGNVPSYFALVQELFLRNMAHYVRGEQMECVVNKRRGY
jgi:phosphoglycerate dehydrogenase-like enzyme